MKTLLLMLCLVTSATLFADDRPLVILSHDRPPFHFKDDDGRVVGICVDIVDLIFQEMGIRYQIVDLKWARVWHNIERGQGEAAFSTSRQPSREPYLFYPKTDMWRSEFVFFTHRSSQHLAPGGTYDAVHRSGGIIGLWKGASYAPSFWQHFPYRDGSTTYTPKKTDPDIYNEQFYIVTSPVQAFKMVSKKRIRFTLEDKLVGQYLLNKTGLSHLVVPYEQPVFSKGYPMPFLKQSTYPNLAQVAHEFEKRLLELKRDGRYRAIVARWVKQ